MIQGYSLGSISMTVYAVGGSFGSNEGGAAASLPGGVPPDQTNT